MARPTIMKIALVIALTIAAGSAYASTITSSTAIGAGSFVPSNNVMIGVVSEPSMYSAHSKHFNGDRIVAFSSTDAKLYYQSGIAVGSTTAAPGASNSYSDLTATGGWYSM